MNHPLAKPLRTQLENAVKAARVVAETGALATLSQLAVGEAKAPDYLTDDHKALRRRLRAHGRALGDQRHANGSQTLQHLVWEAAYEHWHRMLFARFLAENGLLLWEPGAAVSLDDCEALVQETDPTMNLGAKTQWELAGKLAARMLPQVFKPRSPVFELTFAPEHQRELERLLATLPPEMFKASDSLGWVYQFWQAKRKDEVNASEVKIGTDELPAVTQLFTEPYMVDFLLHNSLGAWWAARRLSEQDLREAQTEDELRRKAAIPGVPLDYLRFVFAPAPHDGDDDVVRASSPEKSGQDGLTTQARVPFDERTLEKTHGEYLPHWTCQGAVYHVVFRLADSVPQSKLAQWDEDLAAELTDEALREARYRKHQEMENWLDAGHGVCHFRQPEIAELVANALKHFDGDRYQLHAWCVMPNHVHVIVEPLSDNPLYKIIHSWKSFTANAINRQLGLSGTLWQADAYNHIIRTQKEYDYQVQYVWQNPDKANLPDWPWRWANVVIRASSPEESEESGQDGLTTAGWALAAGAYEGWPDTLADFKLLDPCCGSGHFLVAAFLLLVPMRMVAEDLTAAEAVDAVLRDNLHGLELDARCVEIAVFALALAAWRFPDENGDPLGVRADMPAPQVACCGLKVAAKPEDWEALVPDNAPNAAYVRQELRLLHASFAQAPLLGSLLDPARSLKNDLATSSFDTLRELLERALTPNPSPGGRGEDAWDLALTAKGLLDAARLLDGRYHLVVTNVPYLARGKQNNALKEYCETHYPEAKNDLANVFLERCLELCVSVVRASSPEKADQDGLNAVVRVSSPEKSGQDGLTTCKESGQDGLSVVVRASSPEKSGQDGLTTYKESGQDGLSVVVRASSPEKSGQDGLTTYKESGQDGLSVVVRASSPEKSGQDGLTTYKESGQDGLSVVVRASSPEKSGQDGLTTCKESGQDGLSVVVRASSPEKSGQDGLTTYKESGQDGLSVVVRASSPEKSGQDGLTTCKESGQDGLVTGVVQIVMPQNWLFLTRYKKQRESLLKRVQWNLLGRLGPGAFETISGEVVQAVLLTQTNAPAAEGFQLRGADASSPKSAQEKATLLREGEVVAVSQKGQLANPDARVALVSLVAETFLADIGLYGKGSTTGDSPRFLLEFWQLESLGKNNVPWADSPSAGDPWSGRSLVTIVTLDNAELRAQLGCWLRGQEVWGRAGVAVNKMRELEPFLYSGEVFDDNVCPIIPKDVRHISAVWAFVSDPAYRKSVREVDAALKVTAGTLTKVPFNLPHWQQVAAERYPNGLPKPYSDDPTQWLFHGHPQPATDPLQVAVARLAGYRWPAEQPSPLAPLPEGEGNHAMELSDEAHTWIAHCEKLDEHTDDDGIVCLPSVRGEPAAHDRLLNLLIAAWETVQPGSWKPAVLDKLLADADCAGKGLDVWLRDKFFEQHAKRFHHRPFIWHVWDGLKDGFAALVNYHQLDHKKLERLIHTYLGDWIRQQEAGVRDGIDGAPQRLAAAQDLKHRLELILEGEPPYDIFVRWKPLAEQPMGWNPDLNDGVRLNIRPFMTAEALRHNKKPKLNITWDKDRGKDVTSAPWFHKFNGDRINDHHLTVAEKKAARQSEGDSKP